jgi:hypothetical protein
MNELPEWEQRIRREHDLDKEPEPKRPEDRWITRGQLWFGLVVSVFFGSICLYFIYTDFEWWMPLALILFTFMAGIGAGPLFYKTWYESD